MDLQKIQDNKVGFTRNKPSNDEIVEQLLKGEIDEADLTPAQEMYFGKIKACYALMLKGVSHKTIHKKLHKIYKISYLTRHRLLRSTEMLFGAQKANKEIKRHIAENMALQAFNLAFKDKDSSAMTRATNAYIKATGLENEDPDLPDFKQLNPSLIVTIIPEDAQAALLKMIKGGVMDFNKIPTVEDIDHEEITE